MDSTKYVSESIEIDAAPRAIFDILADPRRHPEIDGSGTLRGAVSGPDRLYSGAKFGMRMKLGAPYQVTNTVIAFTEDTEIAWKHAGKHIWRYEMEPLPGDRTRVTESWDTSPYPTAVRLILGVAGFPQRTRKGIHASLIRLKALAEKAA